MGAQTGAEAGGAGAVLGVGQEGRVQIERGDLGLGQRLEQHEARRPRSAAGVEDAQGSG